jgi:hypothetical protein
VRVGQLGRWADMMLVFQDDGSMRVIESVSEANRVYEAIDVENGEYTFLDDRLSTSAGAS